MIMKILVGGRQIKQNANLSTFLVACDKRRSFEMKKRGRRCRAPKWGPKEKLASINNCGLNVAVGCGDVDGGGGGARVMLSNKRPTANTFDALEHLEAFKQKVAFKTTTAKRAKNLTDAPRARALTRMFFYRSKAKLRTRTRRRVQ